MECVYGTGCGCRFEMEGQCTHAHPCVHAETEEQYVCCTFEKAETPFKILRIPADWKGLGYPDRTLGSAAITHTKFRKSCYLMECVDGYEFYELQKTISGTVLKIHNQVVMIDDPMHFIGMQRLAEACRGRVLIGGLGLGIILHHLAKNKAVSRIDVVEVNKDVIELVTPLLPPDSRRRIHLGNILEYRWVHGKFDTIVLDLWVKHDKKIEIAGQKDSAGRILETTLRFQLNNPHSKVYVWGARDPETNPAVQPMREIYLKFLQERRNPYQSKR